VVLDRLDPRALTGALLGPRPGRRRGGPPSASVRGYPARRATQQAKTLARDRSRAVAVDGKTSRGARRADGTRVHLLGVGRESGCWPRKSRRSACWLGVVQFTVRAAGGMSWYLVFGFDAVLAEQVTQSLPVAAKALDLLGQGRQVRVGCLPLLLAGSLVGEQLPSRSRSNLACSKSWASMADSLTRRTCAICSSRSAVAGLVPTRCSIADSRVSSAVTPGHTACGTRPRRGSPGASSDEAGSLPRCPCSSWITCWRTRFGRCLLAPADDLLDLLADRLQTDPQRLQGPGRHAPPLVDQAKQDVLGIDVMWLSILASSCTRTTIRPARSVNRSNIYHRPPCQ
jgi:hypothetical protein